MEPVSTLAPVLAYACVIALAGLAVHQYRRIAALRAREELLDLELERATQANRPLSVIVGDLDSFAVVNEHHGHAAGDSALQLVASDCLKWKRRIDQAARIGGEEFALLLPETDERGAFIVAERLRRATHRTFADVSIPVTISFGVASSPAHGTDPVSLLRAAELAMAAAKDLGSDRTVIYSGEVGRTLEESGVEADGQLQLATVIALAEALDIRDTGTGQHSHTVGRYSELMARELGFEQERVERVRLAGLLHDIGKIGISDCVLSKPGPLDADEWQEMYTHPEIAARLLSRPEFDDLRAWILAHHERPDGTGYPYGLKGDDIPLEARILAVADAYEAMTADRIYRPALGADSARPELEAGAGSQFDREVVQAFLTAGGRGPTPPPRPAGSGPR